MSKKKRGRLQMQRPSDRSPQQRKQIENVYALAAEACWREQATVYEKAYQGYLQYGRGAIMMVAHTGLAADGFSYMYVPEEEAFRITTEKEKLTRMFLVYDPDKTFICLTPGKDGYTAIMKLVTGSEEEARVIMGYINQADHTQPPLVSNSNNASEFTFRFGDLFALALEILDSANKSIGDFKQAEILRLGFHLYRLTHTIYRLIKSPHLRVLSPISSKSVVDFGSATVLFRSAIDTYLTMHEVFWEPDTYDAFVFERALWYLSGYRFLEYYEGETTEHTEESNRIIQRAKEDMEMTNTYKNLSDKQKESAKKGHRRRKWYEIAKEAGFDTPELRYIYSFGSGFVHADAVSTFQALSFSQAQINEFTNAILQMSAILLAKMITNFADRHSESRDILVKSDLSDIVEKMARLR